MGIVLSGIKISRFLTFIIKITSLLNWLVMNVFQKMLNAYQYERKHRPQCQCNSQSKPSGQNYFQIHLELYWPLRMTYNSSRNLGLRSWLDICRSMTLWKFYNCPRSSKGYSDTCQLSISICQSLLHTDTANVKKQYRQYSKFGFQKILY